MRKRMPPGETMTLQTWLALPEATQDLHGKRVGSCDPGRNCTTYHASVDIPTILANPQPMFRMSDNSGWEVDYERGFSTDEY